MIDDRVPDADLAREAELVLGEPIATVRRLTHSRVTPGVWRVTGEARTPRAGRGAVVKVLVPAAAGEPEAEPSAYRYWLREALVYEAAPPPPYAAAGVRAPKLLRRFDRPNGDVALWLEDVGGVAAAEWDLERFTRAAKRIGRAQGGYLAGAPLPDDPWLSRGFLRQYLADRLPADHTLLGSEAAWRSPSIARHFPAGLRDELVRLHAERERFLVWLEAAPRTYAHLDVWPDNLFDGGDDLVLIDWGFAGIGAAGEDPGNLVPDSVFDLRHPPAMLEGLDRAVFDGYLAGLRDAGWTGDGRLVRLAMCASAIKYDWIAGATLARAVEPRATERIYGGVELPPDVFFATRAAVLAFLAGWADEARSLARDLGLLGPG